MTKPRFILRELSGDLLPDSRRRPWSQRPLDTVGRAWPQLMSESKASPRRGRRRPEECERSSAMGTLDSRRERTPVPMYRQILDQPQETHEEVVAAFDASSQDDGVKYPLRPTDNCGELSGSINR